MADSVIALGALQFPQTSYPVPLRLKKKLLSEIQVHKISKATKTKFYKNESEYSVDIKCSMFSRLPKVIKTTIKFYDFYYYFVM